MARRSMLALFPIRAVRESALAPRSTTGPRLSGGEQPRTGAVMPEWWLEAVLPGVVFTLLFIVWVALPPREGETDLGSRIRRRIVGR